jgi:dihydrofolate reductase
MRKIYESALVSLDGVIGDPQVWAMDYADGMARQRWLEKLRESDAMLMGRGTYELFARLWPAATGPYADRINEMRKYVFSSTLKEAGWHNATIVRGDVATEVAKLKQQDGKDLIIYGHGRLGQTLLERRLLDEIVFSVHPVLVGSGTLAFTQGAKVPLKLVRSEALGTGVVVLSYEPVYT